METRGSIGRLGAMAGLALAGVFGGGPERLARADDWPQRVGPRRDGIWRETGIVDRFLSNGPPVRWRVPVGGGCSGPAVAGHRLFMMDRVGGATAGGAPGGTNAPAPRAPPPAP